MPRPFSLFTRPHPDPRGRGMLAFCLATLAWLVVLAPGLRGEEPPPELTAKAKDFVKKLTDAQRKRLDEKMDKLVAEVVKATGLDSAGSAALTTAARKAEDAEQAELTGSLLKEFAKQYATNKAAVVESFNHPELIELAAAQDLPETPGVSYVHAPDQPAWKDALKTVLTPAQAAAWIKGRGGEDAAVAKAIDKYLDAQAEQTRSRVGGALQSTCDDMVNTLVLSKDRTDALKDLAKQAIDLSVAASRQSTVEALRRYDAATRDRIIKNQSSFYSSPSSNEPEKRAVWTEGIARLLTDDERAKLKAAEESHRTRRVQALGRLFLQVLDGRLAFTREQRPKLQALAERLVVGEGSFFENNRNDYFSYEKSAFYKLAKAAKPGEVQPLLDDVQWRHWQEICQKPELDDDPDSSSNRPAPAAKDAPPGEPEDVEAALTDYLVTRGDQQHQQLNATMTVRAEDIARVTGLEPAHAARLRTAAYGAAEAAAATWTAQSESSVRSELQGATPENVRQKLAGMSRYSFSRAAAEDDALWKKALEQELNDAQRKTWQEEQDERSRFATQALAGFIGAELDRKVRLTADQDARLTAAMARVIEEYAPDLRSTFAYYSSPWYLQSYTLFLPTQGLPEGELKSLLSPSQYTTWTSSRECSNTASYWSNVRSTHERRLKDKKP